MKVAETIESFVDSDMGDAGWGREVESEMRINVAFGMPASEAFYRALYELKVLINAEFDIVCSAVLAAWCEELESAAL